MWSNSLYCRMSHYSWEQWILCPLDGIFFICEFTPSGLFLFFKPMVYLLISVWVSCLLLIVEYCNLLLFYVAVYFSSAVNVCFIYLDAVSTNSGDLAAFIVTYTLLCLSCLFFKKNLNSFPGVWIADSLLFSYCL